MAQPLRAQQPGEQLRHKYSFEELPTELLDAIFLKLSHRNQTSVVRVCQHFKVVVEPILYRSINAFLDLCPGKREALRQFYSANLALAKNLGLCSHVRNLSITFVTIKPYRRVEGKTREEHLASGYNNILSKFPSIQHLSLAPPVPGLKLEEITNPTTLSMDFKQSLLWPSGFGLKKKSALQTMALHFWIPSLRQVQINNINMGLPRRYQSIDIPTDRDRTSSVEDLRVLSWAKVLPVPLRWIKWLKRFVYEAQDWNLKVLDSEPGEVNEPIPLPANEFLDALKPHEESLEDVMVGISDELAMFPTQSIWYLMGYHCLKRLAIPEYWLIQPASTMGIHTLLPRQIEELQIQYSSCLDNKQRRFRRERLLCLAQNKEAHLPALKLVVSWYQSTIFVEVFASWEENDLTGDRNEHEPAKVALEDVGVRYEALLVGKS